MNTTPVDELQDDLEALAVLTRPETRKAFAAINGPGPPTIRGRGGRPARCLRRAARGAVGEDRLGEDPHGS